MSAPPAFFEPLPRFLFFTGKGGVGKTSIACATGVTLAEPGRRVLLVSTDPASNLDELLGLTLSESPRPVPDAPGLFACNLQPETAAAAYRERTIGPMRGLLPEAALRAMEEQLSGACTMEIAVFDVFATWLGDPTATAGYEVVIFDTAPTGHTLRLLALPQAWQHYLDSNTTGSSCLGPLAGLQQQRALYTAALNALNDPATTLLLLVARLQRAPLREATRTYAELQSLGIQRCQLILNGVFPSSPASTDPAARAWREREADARASAEALLQAVPVLELPLLAAPLLGVATLRTLLQPIPPAAEVVPASVRMTPPPAAEFDPWLDELAAAGRGVILLMGKGGVGKTTLAAALAVALADRGLAVHLSTTDPAAHLHDALPEALPGLTLSRIDPVLETAAYTEEVMATQRGSLDEAGAALLEEDLRSPCTEEIAVFRAFARTVALAETGFVVLDTAPTGHTLLLLDTTEAYHRELGRQSGAPGGEAIRQLLPRLRDSAFTKVLLVALPESTPVHEAAYLQSDLRRAGIEPHGWVINQSLLDLPLHDALLQRRAAQEIPILQEAAALHPRPFLRIPWQPSEPSGAGALRLLLASQPMPV